MFYFTHTLNEGTENEKTITETRYIGNEPYNYVYFNCDSLDNQNSETCEVWRIIGIFDVEKEIDNPEHAGQKITVTEQRMKLVRGSSIKNDKWNISSSNDWTTSTLKTYLNVEYYNSLQLSAKSMIDEAKYYLGLTNYYGTTPEKLYTEERGTTLCGACGTDDSKITWQGNVGLMYSSDEYMVYEKGVNYICTSLITYSCKGDNARTGWVYNSNKLSIESNSSNTWLLSPGYGNSIYVLSVVSDGTLKDYISTSSYGIRPVVYLSADVQIFDGDGSEGNPYKLKK